MQRLSTKNLLGFVFLFISTLGYTQNYYWVGGAGSWTDLTHWATTSGGVTKHTILPGAGNDVFFDANSFAASGQTVTITDGATCRSMDWTGSANSPTIYAFVGDFVNIYGSLILPANVTRNFMGEIHFKATTTGHTVNLGGLPLRVPVNEVVYFDGIGGGWTLQGAFEVYRLHHVAGALNTNGQNVTVSVLVSPAPNVRSLTLGASSIICPTWDISSPTGFTVNAGTSTITTSFQFKGAGFTYNNLIVSQTSTILGSNTFNTVTLNAASTINLTSGTNQTLTSLVSNGTVGSPVTIKSAVAGTTATLTKAGGGTVSVANVRLQDNIAAPAATFTATNSSDLGNNTNWTITANEPTSQVSGVSVTKTLVNSVTLNWSNGNGTKRLVIAKAGTAVTANPADNTTYTAGAFGAGTPIAPGEFVVYSGTGNSATVTGLTANTTYHFRVFEFNAGTGTNVNYLITSPATANQLTLPATAVIMSNSPVSVCAGNYYSSGGTGNYSNSENFTQTLSSSTAGSKVRLAFTAFFTSSAADNLKIYDGSNSSAPLIGSYSGSSSPGTITATNAAGQLTLVWASDAFITTTGWTATLSCVAIDTQPTVSASALTYSNIGSSSLTVNFTKGNGGKRIVVARQGSAVTGFTPTNATDYTANSSFGSGTSLSGNYVVYNGSGAFADITNLLANTTYHFAVYEYNGANTSANYKTTTPGVGSTTTSSMSTEPTVATTALILTTTSTITQLSLSWTNGNGARRLIVAREGNPVNALPVDGTLYTATGNFTGGTDLGNGNIVVYAGTGNAIYISALAANTVYHFASFEYNGSTAGTTNYLATGAPTASRTTLATAPTTGASNFNFPNKSFTSMLLQWTNGNGSRRIVVAKPFIGQYPILSAGVEYTANSIYGQGANLGNGSFVVYNGTGSSVEVTGLAMGGDYSFVVYEYNGVGAASNYGPQGSAVGSTLKQKPTVQASNLVASEVTSSSVKLAWQRGNGLYCLVIGRKTDAPTFPRDSVPIGTGYNTEFGANSVINGNSIIAYYGQGTSVTLTRLDPQATYKFTVIELNNTTVNSNTYTYYLTAAAPTVSVETLAGKNFYWVGGKGKWSELSHWATTSGGTTLHTATPTTADHVYFDVNSFAVDGDTVLIDQGVIYSRDMDWTGITKSVKFLITGPSQCNTRLICSGSFKLSAKMIINLREIQFIASTPGQIVDFAGKVTTSTTCSSYLRFEGLGADWTFAGPQVNLTQLSVMKGAVRFNNALVNASRLEFSYDGSFGELELGTSRVTLNEFVNGQNGSVKGGTLRFNSNSNYFGANGGSFRKVMLDAQGTFTLMGGATIDSLVAVSGASVIFESQKTFKLNNFIFKGDTVRSSFIRATTPNSAAYINKPTGVVNINYIFVSDNVATGGGTFNADNSINAGNTSGWNFTTPQLFSPKRNASIAAFTKILHNSMKFRWTKGDGTNRIVVITETSKVASAPSNGTVYTPNSAFGMGAAIGNGYVVSNGLVDSVEVTNLTPGKFYDISFYEANGWNGSIKYLTRNVQVYSVRMLYTDDIVMSNTSASACGVTFFDEGGRGNYKNGKAFTQTIYPEALSPNSKLGALFNYFDVNYYDTLIVYDGTSVAAPILQKFGYGSRPGSTPVVATNSSGALTFRFKPYPYAYSGNYSGWEAELFCAGQLLNEPTTQASNVKSIAETGTTIKLQLTKGNGTGRVIIGRQQAATTRTPIDGADLRASSTFGAGANIGDNNFVVYSGPDETVEVTGLRMNTIYHFTAFEYNGARSAINYLTTNTGAGKDTTLYLPPTSVASNVTLTPGMNTLGVVLNRGNGTGRLLMIKKADPITFVPTDGVEYLDFSNTTQSDFSRAIASYDFSSLSTTGLEQATVYHIKIFEYNGSGKKRLYQKANVPTFVFTTNGPIVKLDKLSKNPYCAETKFSVTFSTSGVFNSDNKFRLQLSDATGNFDNAIILKDTVIKDFIVSKPTIFAKIPGSVASGSGYKVRITSTGPVVVSDSIRTMTITSILQPTITESDSVFTSSYALGNQWLRNGLPIAGAVQPSYRYKLGGVYVVKVTAEGCARNSEPFLITGIEEEYWKQAVTIYPNPVKQSLTIEKQASEPVRYSVYNASGKLILMGLIEDRINLIKSESLPPGLYFIRFQAESVNFTKTFIKE